MDNMELYNSFCKTPENAKKTITGGRLSGFTDVNPMYRIKVLTERFGACGFGWKYVITREWLEHGASGEIAAFVDINLFVKVDGEWSEAIPGTGGSMFVTNERQGARTSDEAFKMALTDALSVACKSLGVAGDVYWQSGHTKYTNGTQSNPSSQPPQKATPQPFAQEGEITCSRCGKPVKGYTAANGELVTAIRVAQYSQKKFGAPVCMKCQRSTK